MLEIQDINSVWVEIDFFSSLGGVPVDFEEVHLDSTVQHIDNVQEAITSIKRNGVAIKGVYFFVQF